MATEKEAVYAELHDLRRRVFQQRKELTALRLSSTAKETAAVRDEAANYRKALSNIRHRLDAGTLDDLTLRRIVTRALLARGLRTKADRDEFSREMQRQHDAATKP